MTSILPSLPETQLAKPNPPELIWRAEAAEALAAAGYERDALQFLNCGREFFVSTCNLDVSHPVDIYPVTCKKRYCAPCEHRAASRRLARYVPALEDIQAINVPGYRLRKIELTTPFNLLASDAPEKWEIAWLAVVECLQRIFFNALKQSRRLSKAEIRRGRADLRKHNLAVLVGGEYGPNGLCLHFHLLLYCMYIDQNILSEVWKEVTKGECEVVWIHEVKHNEVEKAIHEVAKYVTKIKDLQPAQIPFLARVLRGHRRIRTYGLLQSIGEQTKEVKKCEQCGAALRHISILAYFNRCVSSNKIADDDILAHYTSLLNLRVGNKSGEFIGINQSAIPPPD